MCGMFYGLDRNKGVGLSLYNHLKRGNKLPSNPVRLEVCDNVFITTYDNSDIVILSDNSGNTIKVGKEGCAYVARQLLKIANTN